MTDIHDRLSERITRTRLKLEARRSLRPLGVVAVGALIALAAWMVQVVNIGQYAVRSSRTINFQVSNLDGVKANLNEVRFKGIPAGTIVGTKMRDGIPVIEVKVYTSMGPIYNNARAALRPNTVLEDMYLDITSRGTPKAGEVRADRPLPASQTDVSVAPEEIMGAFAPATRSRLYTLLSELGGGLDDRGRDLRESFMAIVPLLSTAVDMTDQIRARDGQTRRLVRNFARLTDELAGRDRELRTLLEDGAETMSSLQASAPDLDATIRELPLMLRELDSTFTAVRAVVPEVNSAVDGLRPVAKALPGGLDAMRRLAGNADPAVRALQTPVKRLNPLATALAPFSRELATSLTDVRKQVPDLDHITTAVSRCMTPLLYFFTYDLSMAKFWDAYGPWPRGEVTANFNTTPVTTNPWSKPTPFCGAGRPASGGRP